MSVASGSADLGYSNSPLDNHVPHVDSMTGTLGDQRLTVLDVADEAAAVGWLHPLAPGHWVAEGVVFRRAPPVPESDQVRLYDMVSAARQFVAGTQKLRGSTSKRNSTWITEEVLLLDEASRLNTFHPWASLCRDNRQHRRAGAIGVNLIKPHWAQ